MPIIKVNQATHDNLPQFVSAVLERVENIYNRLNELERILTSQGRNEEILSVQAASKFLSISKPTLYRLCSEREIPHSKKGGKLFFIKSELEKWVKIGDRKVLSSSP